MAKKIKIKKGDEVIMICGKDKGKRAKVLKLILKKGKVVIEGLNLAKKHRRPTRQGEKGEVILLPQAVDVSNIALYCPRCGKAVKVGYRFSGDKKLRVCKKCQEPL